MNRQNIVGHWPFVVGRSSFTIAPIHSLWAFVYRKVTALAIDEYEFRRVLGHFASGVTVVTTVLHDVYFGLTVSSFTSLSLDPQLVMFPSIRRLGSHAAIHEAGCLP